MTVHELRGILAGMNGNLKVAVRDDSLYYEVGVVEVDKVHLYQPHPASLDDRTETEVVVIG